MKYDIFIIYAREDAKFVRSLAKGLERINISVLYKESLAVLDMASMNPLKKSLGDGFQMALYGIIVISKEFFKIGFGADDLDYLSEVLLMEEQILHPLWYYVNDTEVSNWYPKMGMNIALRFPPETEDSIARKFVAKLAGSAELQHDVLNGFHSRIQYMPPTVSTYRPVEFQESSTTMSFQRTEKQEYDDQGRTSEDTSIPGLNEASNRQSQIKETEKQIDDEPILECFTIDLRHEIGRRLDVYLKGLSNWKDLAGVFRIKDEPELRSLLRTKEPTMSLLDIIAGQGVTVGQLKLALEKIDRCDVVNFIDKYLSSVF
ncbi:uncharacterized protein LOC135693459 [Rhopilema esculentum]|uniref:uncharacterized protein LOC135693459 n=1 Tax=Rhopilema esculentum TaxID=499914 RepID=UPI0031D371BD